MRGSQKSPHNYGLLQPEDEDEDEDGESNEEEDDDENAYQPSLLARQKPPTQKGKKKKSGSAKKAPPKKGVPGTAKSMGAPEIQDSTHERHDMLDYSSQGGHRPQTIGSDTDQKNIIAVQNRALVPGF